MKKIVITLTILFFLMGCQSAKDTKEMTQVTREEQTQEHEKTKQEANNTEQETNNTKQETDNTVTSGKQEKKEENNTTKETKQQETRGSTPPSTSNENTPPVSTPTPPVETKEYVTLSIDCKTILNNMDTFKEQYKSFVPSNGFILVDTKVEYSNGDTVLSLLKKVTKEKGIRMINQAGYISNIANINQMGMQNGQGGWMYKVNGALGDVGAGTYKLSSGDVVQWRYTCYPGDI